MGAYLRRHYIAIPMLAVWKMVLLTSPLMTVVVSYQMTTFQAISTLNV